MKVSVIVPAYNAEKYIAKCLKSVLCQTYANIELIVVDDGSTDRTIEIARAEQDPRLILVQKTHGGVSSARNLGLQAASGEMVTFVDADDSLQPDHIEKMLCAMQKYRSDIVCCGYRCVDSEGNILGGFPKENERFPFDRDGVIVKENLQLEMLLNERVSSALWNKMLRTPEAKAIKFEEEISIGEDLLFLWEYMQKCCTGCFIKDKTYNYFQNPNGAINSIQRQKRFEAAWLSEWKAVCRVEARCGFDTAKQKKALEYKKIVTASKLLRRAKQLGYWDGSCEEMKHYLLCQRWKALQNPYLDAKAKANMFRCL